MTENEIQQRVKKFKNEIKDAVIEVMFKPVLYPIKKTFIDEDKNELTVIIPKPDKNGNFIIEVSYPIDTIEISGTFKEN